MRQALRSRDIGAVFRCVQRFGGVSQARIASAVDMTQGRVNEVINGRREVSRLDVFERVADGLGMPDDARRLLGLAASREGGGGRAVDLTAFPEVARVYMSQASATDEIQHEARTASEVDVLAVRGLGLLALNDSLLRESFTRAGSEPLRLRVLLLHPESPALALRAADIGESVESLGHGVRLAEARLRELAQHCELGIWRYRSLPTWRVIRLDSTLFVSAFDVGWEGHESATYKVVQTPYGPLHRGFRRMFDAMVADSERVV
ncbi:helix-turn-helix domain-containing protein [Streptantibioticus ferralitis]|uniref:Helix-turn-helix transcriptional regulator n=2 Tax=Streptantibioticus ferralitis TaxID=236510 RepID=A0ABT5ZCG7_9ACTN|nr:helix-turn-helix transcriptional regulator [Streptantibioticus ferralitis]